MLKSLFLLFNFASLIVVTALLPADVKVDTSIEEEMMRDSSYVVEVKIQKAKIFGFAKFQQDLPAGFLAKPLETADASFTFADDKVKFIWMALPEVDEIIISYEITPTADAPSDGLIEGKFSYIEDNKRKSYDLPNIPFKVLGTEDIPEEVEPMASVSRSVVDNGDNSYTVTLNIEKQGISGFAKVEEYLPGNAEATGGDTKLGVFSQVDEKTKFVWMSVPADESFSVTYNVTSEDDIMESLKSMEGNFSYLDQDETKSVPVIGGEPMDVAMEDEAVEEEVTSDDSKGEEEEMAAATEDEAPVEEEVAMEDSEPVVVEEEVEEEEPAVEEPAPKKEPVVAQSVTPKKAAPAPVTSVPDPETGVRYRVQIIAGHKMVNKAYIQKTYNYSDDYATENHEGWIKYTTGSHSAYRQARDQREALVAAQHNFPGPFVTAYNSGERITVQEALMITNQKWVQ